MHAKPFSLLGALLLSLPLLAGAAPWKIYLLFGQSNMAGGADPGPEDVFNNPRVKVLAYNNCAGRTYNEWYTATGGLHCGPGFGLGDWFGKVVADSMKQDTIALIPCAIAGVDIDFFRKGVVSARRSEFRIPPDNQWEGAYPWMVERLRKALQKGEMAGILLHQGESDWTAAAKTAWPGKVAGIVSDLKKDLVFGDVPVLIGELRADANACCGGNNAVIAQTARDIPNGHVISSANLAASTDAYHFVAAGLREFGKRYAAAYLKAPVAPTAIAPPVATAPSGWRLQGGLGARTLRFDEPQDRILIRDPQGRLVAEGSGSALKLPGSAGRGLFHFQAYAGSNISTGTLIDMSLE